MMRLIVSLLLFFALTPFCIGQNPLFDDTKLASIYIQIHPDSLEYIKQNVLSDHYFAVRFVYESGQQKDTLENVGFRLRGNTSRLAQKKSYKFSFNEYVPGRRFQEVKKINLNGQHNDPTMVREKFFYDCWKRAGMPERRSSFVRLYVNGSYYGVYTNLEEFDKDWLERVFGENDGNLYKCTYPADLVNIGYNQQLYKDIESASVTGGRAYDLQTNEVEDDYSDLLTLVHALDKEPDSLFATTIQSILDVDEVLKYFALEVATGHWDAYMYNKNNYFLYHGVDGRFRMIAYDTDNTFGVDWIGRDWATRNCLDWVSHSEVRPLANKLLAVPEFKYRYACYLDTLARFTLHPDSLFPLLDHYRTFLMGAAGTDTYRTYDFGYNLADFLDGFNMTIDGHTPYGIKPFLSTRMASTLEQLGVSGTAEFSNKQDDLPLIFPNPASSSIRISTNRKVFLGNYMVSDLRGKKWMEFNLEETGQEVILSLNGLPAGIYLIRSLETKKPVIRKFLKK